MEQSPIKNVKSRPTRAASLSAKRAWSTLIKSSGNNGVSDVNLTAQGGDKENQSLIVHQSSPDSKRTKVSVPFSQVDLDLSSETTDLKNVEGESVSVSDFVTISSNKTKNKRIEHDTTIDSRKCLFQHSADIDEISLKDDSQQIDADKSVVLVTKAKKSTNKKSNIDEMMLKDAISQNCQGDMDMSASPVFEKPNEKDSFSQTVTNIDKLKLDLKGGISEGTNVESLKFEAEKLTNTGEVALKEVVSIEDDSKGNNVEDIKPEKSFSQSATNIGETAIEEDASENIDFKEETNAKSVELEGEESFSESLKNIDEEVVKGDVFKEDNSEDSIADNTVALVPKSSEGDERKYSQSMTNIDEVNFNNNISKEVASTMENDSGEEDTIPNYMKIREQNLKANQEFLASIGFHKAKEDFELSTMKKKPLPSPSQKTPKQPKPKKQRPEEPALRRSSRRIRMIDPEILPLPKPAPVDIVLEEPCSQGPPTTVSMKDTIHFSKDQKDMKDLNLKPFLSTLTSLQHEQNIISPITSNSPRREKFFADIKDAKITEQQVAKVVPGCVQSVEWHPSKDTMIAFAGDVRGFLGCWNVLAKEGSHVDTVRTFRPHLKALTHMMIPPRDVHKLYTSSYDATIRCGDFEKGVFDLVFSVPEEYDQFKNFAFLGNSSSEMLVCHNSGFVSLVDSRSPSRKAENTFRVSKQPLQTLSVHPLSPNYFITAGRDPKIHCWDMRSMSASSPEAVQILNGHSSVVYSAYYDSFSGTKILSSSSDKINVYSQAGGCFQQTAGISHTNAGFGCNKSIQPKWHPTVEGVFVSGSPRKHHIEVFDATSGTSGRWITTLQGDHLTTSCNVNAFHPTRHTAVVGGNSKGFLHVFM